MNIKIKKPLGIQKAVLNGLNDDCMRAEIIKELIALSDISFVTICQFWAWAKRIKAKTSLTAMQQSVKDHKEFDAVKACRNYPKPMHPAHRQPTPAKQKLYNFHPNTAAASVPKLPYRWRYCSSTHSPGQNPAYGKTCSEYSKINYFKVVCQNTELATRLSQDPKRKVAHNVE